jgi:hypothetical protein
MSEREGSGGSACVASVLDLPRSDFTVDAGCFSTVSEKKVRKLRIICLVEPGRLVAHSVLAAAVEGVSREELLEYQILSVSSRPASWRCRTLSQIERYPYQCLTIAYGIHHAIL